ncbi:hypothetical protein [Streptomyces sp. NPDC047841]|uniref:hypothetical protein n=1 Tax=Streptomyces sp. NPDC047841 TaxID=3154708 RepID=UPI003455410D
MDLTTVRGLAVAPVSMPMRPSAECSCRSTDRVGPRPSKHVMRADADIDRDLLLTAARQVVADQVHGTPPAGLARRAGLDAGTHVSAALRAVGLNLG